MIVAFVVQHKDTISAVGILVGLSATGYGLYRIIKSEDRQRMERMEAFALIVGGLFLTISALDVIS